MLPTPAVAPAAHDVLINLNVDANLDVGSDDDLSNDLDDDFSNHDLSNNSAPSEIFHRAVGDWGCPGEMKRLRVEFHSFATLSRAVGVCTSADTAEINGREWLLSIYPGGVAREHKDYLSVNFALLAPFPEGGVMVDIASRLINHNDPRLNHFSAEHKFVFGSLDAARNVHPAVSWLEFIPRATVLDENRGFLKNGVIIIEIDMRVYTKKPSLWHPPPRLANDLLRLFDRGEDADVTFVVDGECVTAHRAILRARASALSTVCDIATTDDKIEIPGVSPAIFKEVVRFAYADELSTSDVLATAEAACAVLSAANRFGVLRCKQLAEVELATRHIAIESAADLLLFADAQSCPLLKENAIEYIVKHADEVMQTDGWTRLAESAKLLQEVMQMMSSVNKKSKRAAGDRDYRDVVKRWRVSDLLNELSRRGHDTDGSRVQLEERVCEGKTADAVAYIERVKTEFVDEPEVYNAFLNIIGKYQAQEINTQAVINRVRTLFRGHDSLIGGFNVFLPGGRKL